MIELRDRTRRLIEYQLEGYPDEAILARAAEPEHTEDRFTAVWPDQQPRQRHGRDDSSYCLLCSLEVIDENGEQSARQTCSPSVPASSRIRL